MSQTTYKEAFAEVYDIINHMEDELYKKIPSSFIELIKNEMNENYEVNIDYEIGINNQELLADTRTILALVYRNFLCDEAKKKELEEEDNEILKRERIENEEKYKQLGVYNELEDRLRSLNIIKEEKNENDSVKEKALIKQDENIPWHVKIFNYIKSFFYNKK